MLKKKISKRIIFIFGIFLGLAAAFSLGAYAESMQSSAVYYDNTTSGGSSNTVSGALDELYEKAKSCSSSGNCPEGWDCHKVFDETSWADIANDVRSGNASYYKVGDTKTITLASHTNDCYSTNGDLSSLYQCNSQTESEKQITLRVANTSECTNGETSETACGFVVEFAEISELHNMNPANSTYKYGYNVGGWPASKLRTYINNTIYNALPSDLQSVIADTKVVSSHGSNNSSNFTSTDKLYLLSTKEIYGTSHSYDTVDLETRQLDYYKNQGTTTSKYSAAIKLYNGSAQYWWLRTSTSIYDSMLFSVNSNGYWYSYRASSTYGVSPAFRIA